MSDYSYSDDFFSNPILRWSLEDLIEINSSFRSSEKLNRSAFKKMNQEKQVESTYLTRGNIPENLQSAWDHFKKQVGSVRSKNDLIEAVSFFWESFHLQVRPSEEANIRTTKHVVKNVLHHFGYALRSTRELESLEFSGSEVDRSLAIQKCLSKNLIESCYEA